ncbi:response regulator [Pseudodesulfovibrio cashew]|uniref:Response regulator n=1 Tax=Pseudodesulfovibrio cashew TaxID=2678688 RepID=A0A6I6JHA4_9BACT|nr:sigma-54 dependent transcriptional regulator [Pseudodesulfovibrio cashew]QGY40549.1 response regulator [Pseudodesulfovibrio cashew]
MARILIIDDDELIRSSLSRCFTDQGHEVATAEGLASGIRRATEGMDVVYLDLSLPDGDGRTAINTLCAAPGNPEVIVLTGLKDNFGAQETLTSGAWDYIQKPATPTTLRKSLESALGYRRDKSAAYEPPRAFDDGGLIGDSPAMERAKGLMARAAESEASVLILGETGVGKELTAQAIHNNSTRHNNAFVVVDCSNLTESLLESVLYGHVKGAFTGAHSDHRGLVAEADGGTLFLDEIGELPPSLQKSFLRVLQEHRFRPVGSAREQGSDFRLVAATNRDLEAMTRAGTFRSDLLFRLRTLEIQLPPLSARGEDVMLLAEHFARKACDRYRLPAKGFSKQIARIITAYAWPGNVRELGHVMEAAVIAAGKEPTIYPKHLPGHIRVSYLDQAKPKRQPPRTPQATDGPIQSYQDYKAMRDQAYFQQLMDICDFDIARASRLSGLSVPSIYRHLGLAGIPTKNKR